MATTYYLRETIPAKIAIKPTAGFLKENISSLSGQVISSCYYFSIKDFDTFNTTINDSIEVYNLITNNGFDIDFSTVESLSTSINNLIKKNFICIQEVNGRTVSGDLDTDEYIPQNIKVLTSFTINEKIYNADISNGVIKVYGNFLSGTPSDYVTSFNGRTGTVKGGITTIIVNGQRQRFDPQHPGLIKLNLASRDNFIATVNGQIGDNITVLQQIKLTQDLIVSANATNRGVVDITPYFVFNNNNVLTGNIQGNNFTFTLNPNLNLTNLDNKSAIANYMLNKNGIKSDNIITGFVNITQFELGLSYMPLHFYDSSGTWLNRVPWSVTYQVNKKVITIDRYWYNNYTNINGSNAKIIYTAMKVTG